MGKQGSRQTRPNQPKKRVRYASMSSSFPIEQGRERLENISLNSRMIGLVI